MHTRVARRLSAGDVSGSIELPRILESKSGEKSRNSRLVIDNELQFLYVVALPRVRIDSRRYANTALRYIIRRRRTVSPQLQTEAVLRRRVRTPAGRGAEPCGVARQNTEDRRKGRARCGCKEAMLKSCRRGAHHSGFCCNSTARPQRQRVLITASAANQRRSRM